jgi:hypothetical protein
MADPTVVLSGAHKKKIREGGGAREGEERGWWPLGFAAARDKGEGQVRLGGREDHGIHAHGMLVTWKGENHDHGKRSITLWLAGPGRKREEAQIEGFSVFFFSFKTFSFYFKTVCKLIFNHSKKRF